MAWNQGLFDSQFAMALKNKLLNTSRATDIAQQQANTDRLQVQSQAAVAAQNAQADTLRARAAITESERLDPIQDTSAASDSARASLINAGTSRLSAQTEADLAKERLRKGLVPSYKKGTSKVVPKKGAKTQKAVLHKGEAVLNAPAARMAGRGLIAALNAKGRMKMGMS